MKEGELELSIMSYQLVSYLHASAPACCLHKHTDTWCTEPSLIVFTSVIFTLSCTSLSILLQMGMPSHKKTMGSLGRYVRVAVIYS